MSRSRAIRTGATAILRQPLVMLAELAWRWTLATAVIALGGYSLLLFLHSLPVTDRDMFGLSGVIPALFWQTVAHIFSGSGPKVIRIAIILAVGYSGLWWLAASFGRAATLRALAAGNSEVDAEPKALHPVDLRSVFGLNALRVLFGFAAALAYVAAFLLAASASGMDVEVGAGAPRAAGAFYLLFIPLAILVGSIWSMLSWYLSLALVVGAAGGRATDFASPASALSSLFDSALISRRRSSQFAWVGFVFGILRFVLYIAAWFIFLAVIGLLAEMPGGIVLGVLFLLALVYSFFSTMLQLVRLASYMRIVEWDAEQLSAPAPPLAIELPPAEPKHHVVPQFAPEPPPEPAS